MTEIFAIRANRLGRHAIMLDVHEVTSNRKNNRVKFALSTQHEKLVSNLVI